MLIYLILLSTRPDMRRPPITMHAHRSSVFMKKYMHIAESFPEVVLLQMFGDESQETRKLMVSMKVKVRVQPM